MSQLELFEERAAIMQHDGGMTRQHAERCATADVFPFLPMTQEQAREFKGIGWAAGKAVRFLARRGDA